MRLEERSVPAVVDTLSPTSNVKRRPDTAGFTTLPIVQRVTVLSTRTVVGPSSSV